MKKLLMALVLCNATQDILAQDLTPNSQHFNVSNFLYLNPSTRNLDRYQAVGFYQQPIPGVQTKVFIMPQIAVRKPNGVTFIGKTGLIVTNEETVNEETVAKVKISLRYDGNLPNNEQKLGMLAQIYATGVTYFRSPRNVMDHSVPGPLFMNSELQTLNATEKSLDEQQATILSKWGSLSPSVVAINAVKIQLLLDGTAVGEQVIPASLISVGGTLPDFYLEGLNNYQINRFKQRQFQVRIDFSFRDASTGSITANFDAEKMMNQLVQEEQSNRAINTKSGVQFLGFGKRKSKMATFIRESASEKITQDNRAKTIIQIDDADQSLINIFESQFFPTLSKAQVVNAHLEAAQVAESAGKADLAKAHLGYATAVQQEKLDLEVDVAGAMASLAAGDYAGFIAKGVKMQKSESSSESQFARVLTRQVDAKTETDWKIVKTVSTQRTVSQVIELDADQRKPYVGLCGIAPYNLAEYGYSNIPRPLPTILVTCVEQNSPLAHAGIVPGMFIRRVNGKVIKTPQEMTDEIALYNPGDTISIQKITNLVGPGAFHPYETVQLKLGRGQIVIE